MPTNYINSKEIDINDEPELAIIRDHLEEYYPDKEINVLACKNDKGKITANFYINYRLKAATSALGNAWICRVKNRRGLSNKLTLLGIIVH